MLRKLKTWSAAFALALICLASFGMMLWAANTDSAIMDELAHIPAGYGYVSHLDYRLNPEHPPLIKALAALPVWLFMHPTYPTDISAWTREVNGEWGMGVAFLYRSGNDANAIIRTARVMPILVTILTVILVWFLARRLVGDLWALLPAFMFAFDPAVLANGHYVTTDVGAAFGTVLSLLFFLRYLETPSAKRLWLAGIAFGIAQLTKFSTPLLIPLYLFLAIVLAVRDTAPQWRTTARRWRTSLRTLARHLSKIILIFAIGYAVIVYPAYLLLTAHEPIARQASDTATILASFSGGPTPAGHLCRGMRCFADADVWMSRHYATRPIAQYLLGILMVLQRAGGGNTIYFLGHVSQDGGWIYFPALFFLTEPVPTLIIVFLALALASWWTVKRTVRRWRTGAGQTIGERILAYLHLNFAEFSMASFIALYWGISMKSPLNIGIRHLMPTIPLIFILAAVIWKKWVMRLNFGAFDMTLMDSARAMARSIVAAAAKYILLILLLFWLLLETLFAAPYFLSYFNEFGGGVWGGYHFVTDSNYDWGQDLLRLQAFVAAHPGIDTIAVDYFGGGDPRYSLGGKEVNWSPAMGNPADHGIHWLAVSVNQLELATQPLLPGETRNASDTYAWLTALRPPQDASGTWLGGSMGNVPAPDYRAGTSIFIYHL